MLHGGVEFAFDAGDGLEQELAEVAECVGGLVRDALFGQGGEDFPENVVYVGDRVELAGEGGELGGCRKRGGPFCEACGRCGRRKFGEDTCCYLDQANLNSLGTSRKEGISPPTEAGRHTETRKAQR